MTKRTPTSVDEVTAVGFASVDPAPESILAKETRTLNVSSTKQSGGGWSVDHDESIVDWILSENCSTCDTMHTCEHPIKGLCDVEVTDTIDRDGMTYTIAISAVCGHCGAVVHGWATRSRRYEDADIEVQEIETFMCIDHSDKDYKVV